MLSKKSIGQETFLNDWKVRLGICFKSQFEDLQKSIKDWSTE